MYIGVDGTSHEILDDFLVANPLFIPGVVFPPPFDTSSSSGTLLLFTEARNLSSPTLAPPGVNQGNVRDEVFNELLGEYICSVENAYGDDSATTIISECSGKCVR